MKFENRNASIELLRIICMLMVIVIHFYVYSGLLGSLRLDSLEYTFMFLPYYVSRVSVNIFVLISAYFLIEMPFKISKMLDLELQVLFYSLTIYVVACLDGISTFSFGNVIKAVTPLSSGSYWYATNYFILLLLAPFLNKFLNILEKKQHLRLIVLLVTIYSVWQIIVFWNKEFMGGQFDFAWFMVLYIIGAFIRKYNIHINSIVSLIGGGGVLLIGYILRLGIKILSGIVVSRFLIAYYSPVILAASIFIFLVFLNMTIPGKLVKRRIIKIGKYSFGAYLLHENYFIKDWLWQQIKPDRYISYGVLFELVYMLAIVILIYTVGCIVEFLRRRLFELLKINKLVKKADNVGITLP